MRIVPPHRSGATIVSEGIYRGKWREEGEIERENRDRRHRSMQTSGLPRVSIFSPLETRRDIPPSFRLNARFLRWR